MKKLIEVVELVAEKYLHTINLILEEDLLTIEYLTDKYGEKDDFKIMQVKEFGDNLSVRFITEKYTKIVNIKELEHIFEILDKQSHFIDHNQEEIEFIRKKFIKGTRLKINKVYNYTMEIDKGTEGTVNIVDDIGNIHVILDNRKTTTLIVGIDEFQVLKKVGDD